MLMLSAFSQKYFGIPESTAASNQCAANIISCQLAGHQLFAVNILLPERCAEEEDGSPDMEKEEKYVLLGESSFKMITLGLLSRTLELRFHTSTNTCRQDTKLF